MLAWWQSLIGDNASLARCWAARCEASACSLRVTGNLLHGGGHLLHCDGDLMGAVTLGFRGLGRLARGGRDTVRRVANRSEARRTDAINLLVARAAFR